MPNVWLVGEDNNLSRTLLCTDRIHVADHTQQRRDWGLLSSTGHVLKEGDIVSSVDSVAKVEAKDLPHNA